MGPNASPTLQTLCSGLASSPGAPSAKNVCPSRDELSKPLELMPVASSARANHQELHYNPKPQTLKIPQRNPYGTLWPFEGTLNQTSGPDCHRHLRAQR